MPLKDWNQGIGAFIALLESLPNDDNTLIGTVNPSTGEVTSFDKLTRDKIEELLYQSQAEPNNPEILCQIQEVFP
jgi:hypothetical protein